MGSNGTLRVISGEPDPVPSPLPEGGGFRLGDDGANGVAVRTVEGRLVVSGEGAFEVVVGRVPGLRRRVRPSAPVPPLLRQGQRLTMRAGARVARLAYDPDRMLPVPLRVVAKASRLVAMPLWAVPAAGAALMWLLGVASVYYGGMPSNGVALELARLRGSGAYERVDTSTEALMRERSPTFIKVNDRVRAERAAAQQGDAR